MVYAALPDGDPPSESDQVRPGNAERAVAARLQIEPQITVADLAWHDFHGIALPSSAADGPRENSGELAAGFSQTPRGALLAAVHITGRANSVWGPHVFETTIARQIAGPDAEALTELTRRAHQEETRRRGLRYTQALPAIATIEGFRWLGYTPDVAGLDLLSSTPGDSDSKVRASTRIWLRWQATDKGGDWSVIAPPKGDWSLAAVPVTSSAGYTTFAANG
ncbi:hypothetical protein ACGFNU_44125 [Spirillospora sp. NPDC048911]|uniref:hypothetical protein n=1 Tax=Spirillospora sp. NPDC048911 TaxID=3364527 RepID=UPI0037129DF7